MFCIQKNKKKKKPTIQKKSFFKCQVVNLNNNSFKQLLSNTFIK